MEDSGMALQKSNFSPESNPIFCNLEPNQVWPKAAETSGSKGASSPTWIESELLASHVKEFDSIVTPQSLDLEEGAIADFKVSSEETADPLNGVGGQDPLVGELAPARVMAERGAELFTSGLQASEMGVDNPVPMNRAASASSEKVIGETGTVTGFNHQSQTIYFDQTYTNPVVFAQPLSFNGGQPAIVRIENIQRDRFTAAIQEPSNLDGVHIPESFSYLVLEAGNWELANGALLEVGTLDTNLLARSGFESIDFSQSFNAAPAVFSQVQTRNGGDFVRTRQKDTSANGFQLAMEEEEALQFSGHTTETVGWLAMSTGQGAWNGHTYQVGQTGDNITHKWRSLDFGPNLSGPPQFLASLATYDGKDPAGLRYRNLSGNGVQIKVEEDTSVNQGTKHTTERASFLAIGGSGFLTAIDSNDDGNTGGDGIVFPNDAGVIDVRLYGAIPDDGKDDTAAIQRALDENPSGNHIFYFSDGVYDISNTLTLANQQKRNIFQGQSESDTVLRLMDSVKASFSGALIRTGGNNGNTTADRFRNSVRNLTLNVGVNHPNAKGLQFWASNQGTVKDVTIKSEDGQGEIGLDMEFDDAIGPLLIQDVTVDGFDYGIKTRWQTASQTFEDITLTNQNVYGWWNTTSQRVFARNVQSTNAVTAIRNDGEAGFVLVDSALTGIGAAASKPAIINQKSMYVSHTQTAGYSLGVDNILNFGRGNPDAPVGYIDEFWANGSGPNRSGAPFELFSSPDGMLGLPIQETPEVAWETNLNNWDGPHRHVIGSSGVPNDGLDDTASIQAAIDSGATTIYLPRGTWNLNGTLELGGNVSRFLGTEANLRTGDDGVIRVVDGAEPVVVIERLEGLKAIEHASDRTLVLNNLLGFQYVPAVTAPGDVFINDAVGSASTFRNQNVWARQLNIETNTQDNPTLEAKVLNDNSQVWILGMKSEDEGTVIKTINGGQTELLGTHHVGSGVSNTNNPRFVTIDSSFSVAGIYGGGFTLMASETRNGVTRTTDTFNLADVYTAYAPGVKR